MVCPKKRGIILQADEIKLIETNSEILSKEVNKIGDIIEELNQIV